MQIKFFCLFTSILTIIFNLLQSTFSIYFDNFTDCGDKLIQYFFCLSDVIYIYDNC